MTVLVLFYLTIFAAWRYRVSYREPWLYAAIALAGVAMADKFFLPALVAPTMIVVFQPSRMDYSKFFLAVCVFIAFFCGASFFNFTPWDFRNLFEMLLYDNLVVEGGKSPLYQLFLYSCEIIPCSGVLTSAFAFIGCLVFFRRAVVGWISRGTTVLSDRENIVSGLSHKFLLWLYTPASILIAPLTIHALLIITAQVHFPRHVLVFVPIVCLLAAIGVEMMVRRLQPAPVLIRCAGITAALALFVVQLVNGFLTDKIYSVDIRINLADFLNENGFTRETETFDSYTYLKGVSVTDEAPAASVFITCDLEYTRYLSGSRGIPTYHLTGGKARTDFYTSLFNGKAGYTSIFNVKRKRHGLEDRLGWLPLFAIYVPNECYAFKRNTE